MPDNTAPMTLQDCAKKFRRNRQEVEDALISLGLVKRVPKGMPVTDDMVLKLTEHFRAARAAKQSEGSGGRSRKVDNIEVTEKKTRAKATGGRLSLEELRRKKSGAPAAAAPPPPPPPKKAEEKPKAPPPPPKVEEKPETEKPAADKKADAAPAAEEKAQKKARKVEKDAAAPAAEDAAPEADAETTAATATADAKDGAEAADTAVAEATAAAIPDNSNTSNLQSLIDQQITHKKKLSEKDKQLQEAKSKKAVEAAARKARKKGNIIKLDKAAVDKHKKKRQQHISRTEAREITAENQHTFQKPTAPVVREIKIPEGISVAKLAAETALKSGVIIRKLMDHGMSVTANEVLDKETAWIIVEELGHIPVEAPDDDMEKDLLKRDVTGEDIQPRAPVVTVMGHVDHGKTSLLDHIRKTRVASGEAGGITQHIGAYRVDSKVGPVTFLDTPGHALFSQMRARGAKVTDIVLLVVAADDGVKPQTIEAINHAKAANVPIIVAANKMDKPEADLERVKRELSTNNVLPEDWGGDTIVKPVSAQSGEGIDDLLEALALQTELLELSAPLDVPAVAVVIEARVDKGRGIVATLVVTRGVLKRGDSFLCGTESGRVRAMWNVSNPKLDEALPSTPVEIQGLSGVPDAGAELVVVEDERTAREVAAMRQDRLKISKLMSSRRLPGITAGNNSDQAAALLDAASSGTEWKELNVVVKADVEGSREAMVAALSEISGKNAGIKVIHSAVGTVTESDIYLAQTGGGVIIGFNVRPDSRARKLAESRGVKIIAGNIVYELVEKAREAVLGLLAPIVEEAVIGSAAVQKVFNISKIGNVAGCLVEEGAIRARAPVRLLRDGVMVHEGAMSSLFHFKDEVSEVRAGSECGICINRYNDIKPGDVIEALERTETEPEL